jgi:hypothetical protein
VLLLSIAVGKVLSIAAGRCDQLLLAGAVDGGWQVLSLAASRCCRCYQVLLPGVAAATQLLLLML